MTDEETGAEGDAEVVRRLLDGALVGTYLATREGRCLTATPALARILGFGGPEELTEPNASEDYDLYGDAAVREDLVRRVDAHGIVARFECEARRKDGTLVILSHTVCAVRDGDGRLTRLRGLVQDVTSHKRAEQALLEVRRHLDMERGCKQLELEGQRAALAQSQKLADMGILLAGVAHELNNPLSILLGQAQLMLREVEPGPLARRAESIARATDRCVRIVRNFLGLARHHAPERQPVALGQVVHDAVELMAYALRVDGVEVALDLAHDLPAVSGDPHQLQQVVVNFLTNAHHAVRGAGRGRTIRLSTVCTGAGVALSVEDSGPGIPEALRPRVFEPFFTTKPAGEGTGLGLPLCLGIVEAHGGRIEAGASETLGGARLTIELPVLRAASRELAWPAPAEPPVAHAAGRILVVDDEPVVADVVAETLSEEGHAVDVAGGGAEALERLRSTHYDVVLTDIRMPGLDGISLYEAVRHLPRGHQPIFVFMTGDGLTPRTREFLSRPEHLHIEKPFHADQVRTALRHAWCRPPGRA